MLFSMSESVKNCLEVEYMRFKDLKCKNHGLKCSQVLSKTAGRAFFRRVGNEGVKLSLEEGE